MALLAMTWAHPRSANADAYALQVEKTITDTLKPNVLVVLETAQSLQDLPGENAARYNEVGADCEEGSRQCRLVGQTGRWEWSGMGSKGISFGDPNASCTATVTNTITNTITVTSNPTSTRTTTATSSANVTGTLTNTQTNTNTSTNTNSTTNTGTNTTTTTATQTQSNTNTTTNTNTSTGTNTQTQTQTSTNTNTVTNSNTNTVTNTATNTNTSTNTTTSTTTTTSTNTATNTNSNTNTNTVTNSTTNTATSTVTGTVTGSATNTVTTSNTSTVTNTGTATNSQTITNTNTNTNTITNTGTTTNTNTVTNSNTTTATQTQTSSKTTTATQTNTNTSYSTSVTTATLTLKYPTTVTVTATNTTSWSASSLTYNNNNNNGYMNSNGTTLTPNYNFGAGTVTVGVPAHEDACAGDAHMPISVGGNSIGASYVTNTGASWQTYTFSSTVTAGSQAVSVIFDNDYYVGCDRNLYINGVNLTNYVTSTATSATTATRTMTQTVPQTSSSTNTQVGAVCTPAVYGSGNFTNSNGSGSGLWANGYISTQNTFVAGSTTITVTASGDYSFSDSPHMTVAVGTIGSPTTIGSTYVTPNGGGNFSPYTFAFTASAGLQEIRVTFDNDWVDSYGNDCNLYLGTITVNCPESTGTVTGTSTVLGTGTATWTSTGTSSSVGSSTSTSSSTGTLTATGTTTGTTTNTNTGTTTVASTACSPVSYDAKTVSHTNGSSVSDGWQLQGATNFLYQTGNVSYVAGTTQVSVVASAFGNSGASPVMTVTAQGSGNVIGVATVTSSSMSTFNFTFTSTASTTSGFGVTLTSGNDLDVQSITISCPVTTVTATSTISAIGTTTTTSTTLGTVTGTSTSSSTSTGTATASGTATTTTTSTTSGTATGTATASGTSSATATGTATGTGTQTASASGTMTTTNTGSGTNSGTVTGTGTVSQTTSGTGTSTSSSTGTRTATSTSTSTNSYVDTLTLTVTVTDTLTQTDTQTATGTATAVQVYACGSQGSIDPLACNSAVPTTTGFCNFATGVACASDSTCSNLNKGDFCRYISTLDGSGRNHNEPCVSSSGSPWGSCKHGVVTANTTCTSSGDTSCNTALAGDFCAEGRPAKMCADSGLWCDTAADCPGNSSTDICVGASSRMMTVKRALRRAITKYSDKVSFGFMNTYQSRGLPSTATDASTAIYPYVKLQSCPSSANITETKLLARGELEKTGCFDSTNGPASTCTVDYGGNGAINHGAASLNQIAYSLVGVNDSRWAIPRSDGSGKFNHVDASWSSCSTSPILPACEFASQGTGLYEGSYYSFTYKQGTPIANGGVDGEGSRAHPKYFTTYMGKYYDAGGGNCYNAVDAERTDIVNDDIYGRVAYTGTPYNSSNEVGVPWSGSTNTAACDATTGADWNSNVVPFLTDTTFNSTAVTSSQKALMIAGRLEKASFGGVDATGSLAPLSCTLKNDGAADKYHSAADYMSQVKTTDASNNGGNTPCWSNNIVLVVDGQPNGPGDIGSSIDCASTACAYNASSNTTLAGCSCTAITKAFALAQAGIETHVVVNAPNYANDTLSWSTRFPYTYAFLWNVAVAGSPNHDGTPSFGTTEDEVYKAISAKIAAAAYHFTETSAGAVAGATTQNPTTNSLTTSALLYDTSVSYPSWQGTVRSFNGTAGASLDWDAATVAASGHPGWNQRRIYFSDQSGNVVPVQISNDSNGSIVNESALYSAGLGANATEAGLIMQWLLGKPGLGNPNPLMGPVTSSTPIAVGQGAANGLNGSTQYSQMTFTRPQLVYVGADDGMLHAFFAQAGTVTLSGVTYSGGEEAFAFIPNDMLPVITKLYAQGGQELPFDKSWHIFGLASSPKVKDMCIGATCQNSTGDEWHTVLVMPEGAGGNKPFALDVTNVIDATNGLQPGNLSLLWSTAATNEVKPSSGDRQKWDQALGQTTAVPAFYFAGYSSGAADNRVLFSSGYPTTTRTGSYTNQGLTILNADAVTGAVKDTQVVPTPQGSACSQTRALLADIALARDYSSAITSQNLMAAYAADTWGNTFQYVPTAATKVSTLYTLGSSGSSSCDQPIYFAPAVAQLDRSPTVPTSSKHFIYLAQVTGSVLDPVTARSRAATRAHSSWSPSSTAMSARP